MIRKDLSLIPLVENNFNMAKSNIKLMEYSALGIPCICSNFPDSPYIDAPVAIANGNTDLWLKTVKIFIKNEEYYKRHIGLALDYAEKYSIKGNKGEILKEII